MCSPSSDDFLYTDSGPQTMPGDSKEEQQCSSRASVHRLRFVDATPSGVVCSALHPSRAYVSLARENGDIELWACDSNRPAYTPEFGGNANTAALGMPMPWALLASIPGSAKAGIQAMTWASAAGGISNDSIARSPTDVMALRGSPPVDSLTAGSAGPGFGGCRLLLATLGGALLEADWATLSLHTLGDSHGGAAWSLASFPLLASNGSSPGASLVLGSVVAVGCEDGSVRVMLLSERDGNEYSGVSSGSARLGRLEHAGTCPGSDGRVLSLAWHPTLPVLFTGTSHGVIRGWDVSPVTIALTKGAGKGATASSNLAQLMSRGAGAGTASAPSAAPAPVVRMQIDSAMPGLAATATHGKATGPSTCVWALAVTRELLVISGDSKGAVHAWDGRTGTLAVPAPLTRHDADVLTVAVAEASGEGSGEASLQVASAGVDGKVTICRRVPVTGNATGKGKLAPRAAAGDEAGRWVVVGSHRGHAHDVRSLVFHPDGTWVASASADGFVAVIAPGDVNTRHPLRLAPFAQRPARTLAFASPPAFSAALSADAGAAGVPLLVASQQPTGIDLWAVSSAPVVHSAPGPPPKRKRGVEGDDALPQASVDEYGLPLLPTLSTLGGLPGALEPSLPGQGMRAFYRARKEGRRDRKLAKVSAVLHVGETPQAPLHARVLRIALDVVQRKGPPGTTGARNGASRPNSALLALAAPRMSKKARAAGAAPHPSAGVVEAALAAAGGDDADGGPVDPSEAEGAVAVANPSTLDLSGDGSWLAYATAAGLRLLHLRVDAPRTVGDSEALLEGADITPTPVALPPALLPASAASSGGRGWGDDVASSGSVGLDSTASHLQFVPLSDGAGADASPAPQLLLVVAGGAVHVSVVYAAPASAGSKRVAPHCEHLYSLPLHHGVAATVAIAAGLAGPAVASPAAGFAASASRSARDSLAEAGLAAMLPASASATAASGGRASIGVKIASAALTQASRARQSLGRGRRDSDEEDDSSADDSDAADAEDSGAPVSLRQAAASMAVGASSAKGSTLAESGPLFVTALAAERVPSSSSEAPPTVTLALGLHTGHVALYSLTLAGGRLAGVSSRAPAQPSAFAFVPLPRASAALEAAKRGLMVLLRSGQCVLLDAATGALHSLSQSLSSALMPVWHAATKDSASGSVVAAAKAGAKHLPRLPQMAPSIPRSLLVLPRGGNRLQLVAMGPDNGVTITIDRMVSDNPAGPVVTARAVAGSGGTDGSVSKRFGTNVLGAALVRNSATTTGPASGTEEASAPSAGGGAAAAGPHTGSGKARKAKRKNTATGEAGEAPGGKSAPPAVTLALVELPWRSFARHHAAVLARKRYGT